MSFQSIRDIQGAFQLGSGVSIRDLYSIWDERRQNKHIIIA